MEKESQFVCLSEELEPTNDILGLEKISNGVEIIVDVAFKVSNEDTCSSFLFMQDISLSFTSISLAIVSLATMIFFFSANTSDNSYFDFSRLKLSK